MSLIKIRLHLVQHKRLNRRQADQNPVFGYQIADENGSEAINPPNHSVLFLLSLPYVQVGFRSAYYLPESMPAGRVAEPAWAFEGSANWLT
jgi:hypothetical protein